ncbi:MAG: cytochrome c oxidase subunit 2A [Deltaproteobacteria bacterium]|nr:cytochrome c oxidase subunit 2A [Deltaproteobacteria bacterium]
MAKNGHPRGTLAVLIIFLLVILLAWGGLYLVLLGRG